MSGDTFIVNVMVPPRPLNSGECRVPHRPIRDGNASLYGLGQFLPHELAFGIELGAISIYQKSNSNLLHLLSILLNKAYRIVPWFVPSLNLKARVHISLCFVLYITLYSFLLFWYWICLKYYSFRSFLLIYYWLARPLKNNKVYNLP